MATYVFAGQGTQKKGMGGALFDEFKELTAQADAVLGYSIRELCLEDPRRELARTQFTQPAIYVVNALAYQKRLRQSTRGPDRVAGHSLGEYNALLAAGAFDFETGLALVKKRGELIAQCGGGGMAAVIGLSRDRVDEVLKTRGLEALDLANDNAPAQIVIAGPRQDLARAQPHFEAAGATSYVPLNVSGPFHSRYMREACEGLAASLASLRIASLEIPVIANVHARPYADGEIEAGLVEQIVSPVRWTESIRYLLDLGETHFEELGQGEVLIGLIRKIQASGDPTPTPPQGGARNGGERRAENGGERRAENGGERRAESGERRRAGSGGERGAESGEERGARAADLGSRSFREDHGVELAYAAGSAPLGVSSVALVARMARSKRLAYFGAGDLEPRQVDEALRELARALPDAQAWGASLRCDPGRPAIEAELVELYLERGVRRVEASGYLEPSPPLVAYRLKGLSRGRDGEVVAAHRVMARVSRPEVAERMASPAPDGIVQELLRSRRITEAHAALAPLVPLADDVCVEADSGGVTARRSALALFPAVRRLRDELARRSGLAAPARVGLAGGIGTPEAAAAAFALGAEFIVTGSINHCTVESGLSDAAKDLLEQMDVQDTEYVPAFDLESGAVVQVLKKGVLFPVRANRLLELYRRHDALEAIEPRVRAQIQDRFFRQSFDDVERDLRASRPEAVERAGRDSRARLALIFGWYLRRGAMLAIEGDRSRTVDYQIPCGPALGAFNRWVAGTGRASWRSRHADEIAGMIMEGAAGLLAPRGTAAPAG
jgi:trans-AT polyketide synthase/acyltransferase/oxidoreductase domain-containing protein